MAEPAASTASMPDDPHCHQKAGPRPHAHVRVYTVNGHYWHGTDTAGKLHLIRYLGDVGDVVDP